jgi:hypothetical protein
MAVGELRRHEPTSASRGVRRARGRPAPSSPPAGVAEEQDPAPASTRSRAGPSSRSPATELLQAAHGAAGAPLPPLQQHLGSRRRGSTGARGTAVGRCCFCFCLLLLEMMFFCVHGAYTVQKAKAGMPLGFCNSLLESDSKGAELQMHTAGTGYWRLLLTTTTFSPFHWMVEAPI